MKKKDIIYIVLAAAILAIAGLLLYSRSSSNQSASSNAATVEVIDPISSDFNQTTLSELQNPSVTQNFSVTIDLSGLGNSQPFGPLQ